MNTKLFSVISGIILINATGIAIAESIHLSNTQMDTVTAGTEGESFSQSSSLLLNQISLGSVGTEGESFSQASSSSQVSIQDDGTTYYSMSASAQGDSATASAEVQIFEPGTLIPFTAFIEAP